MPTLADLRQRFTSSFDDNRAHPMRMPTETSVASFASDEVFVNDARSGLTPVQVVEGKFGLALDREEARLGSTARAKLL
jgi:hypothetical protein